MKSWHFLTIFVFLAIGIALQKYFNVTAKVGLG